MSQGNLIRIQKARFFRAFFYLTLFILAACTTLESRKQTAADIIDQAGLQAQTLPTSPFNLYAVHNNVAAQTERMTIVIEGDGYAWIGRYRLSDNPTPTNPIGLKIASALNTPAVYLARPCQYVSSPNCTPDMWSYNRFNNAVMASYMNALDMLVQQYGVKEFDVIGFSGGAYIALNLSAKRGDIKTVTTVAGVLDPKAWTDFHDISSLKIEQGTESLLLASQNTQFKHLCSHDDDIVPCVLVDKFIAKAHSMNLSNHHILKFSGEGHETLWRKY